MVRSRFFHAGGDKGKNRKKGNPASSEIDQSFYYMYLVLGLQVLFLFALLTFMMLVGKVLSMPWWVFLLIFFGAIGGCVFLYMRIKKKFKDLKKTIKDTLEDVDLSGRNYEIRIMGGVLTLRVEQNPSRMLESRPVQPLLEDKTFDLAPEETRESGSDKDAKKSGNGRL